MQGHKIVIYTHTVYRLWHLCLQHKEHLFNLHAKGGLRHEEQSVLRVAGNRRSEADIYLQQFEAAQNKNKIKPLLLKQT